jgi:hypothetical protein
MHKMRWTAIRFQVDMASQPTLSRIQNAVGPRQLYHMGTVPAECVIGRHAQWLSAEMV